ncbi:redoxin domain-containing protein [Pseudohoeflea coraliihabitans]|uniref:Redoxin domain-containing protein n=1 Tax=Pseudohoeflea coraliihabitans TaxID=2860393 RepID=A0ABS6WK73_9HYPH|nr:redoxin domain-containing protein [Pseudohoeflea sp. DP4N28-3]MBW3096338.1 redoxin domain-containing protein [Pseudohoeflea sp. DP4N28-3]
MTQHVLLPGSPAPALSLPAIGGGHIDLAATKPTHFTVVFFYRGVHCPICKSQLEEVAQRGEAFEKRGLAVLAASMDSEERAQRQREQWDISALDVGYGLSEDDARQWGLFISKKEKDAEPERFAEPGIGVIYPDGKVYALFYQSVPFARPRLDDLLKGLDFIIAKNYPANGTLAA